MPRDWSRESWHKVYPREDGAWLAMSWQARGLYRLLQSEASRDGAINLGKFAGSGFRWVAVVFRMRDDEAQAACDELEADGFIVAQPDGSWLLPHHADQQATSTTSAERVKRHRERHRVTDVTGAAVTPEAPETDHVTHVTLQPLHVTSASVTVTDAPVAVTNPSVTVKRKEREERGDKKDEKATRARAREAAAAASVDPKVRRIALELAAHKKFANLDHACVAEELLGGLGGLALGLVDERIPEAVALAAAEAESGANERRLRQVLSWKLKDAASGKTKAPRVQGDDASFEAGLAKIYADIEEFNSRPPEPSDILL
jgi:hypothetical protein